MASTFSTRLKIELIGDGEQAGSWGTTTNNNLDLSLEQAIAGVLTVATTGNGTGSVNGLADGEKMSFEMVTPSNLAEIKKSELPAEVFNP